jgi:hypothetical protein
MPGSKPKCESCNVIPHHPHTLYRCKIGGEMRCKQCQRDNNHHHNQTSSSTSSKQQQQSPIFEKSSEHHRISIPQRYTIIILHLLNKSEEEISQIVNCHVKSVRRWIHHFKVTGEFTDEAVEDLPREGNNNNNNNNNNNTCMYIYVYVYM